MSILLNGHSGAAGLQSKRDNACTVLARPAGSNTRYRRGLPSPSLKLRSGFVCRASSTQVDKAQLLAQRSQPWNRKLGAVYQHLLPGPLLFLPSLLQPVSTLISVEGAKHGHEWVHWLLAVLPVRQVRKCLRLKPALLGIGFNCWDP